MRIGLQSYSQFRLHIPSFSLARGIGWGLMGGLVSTMVMDIVLMGALLASGRPTLTCFSIIGNTVAHLFSGIGTEMAGGVPVGVATHYLIGPILGAIFGAAVIQIDIFRINSLKKGVILAVLFVEILSQPVLAMTPILLKMTILETFQWFGGSFVMHLIWGVVLGVVMNNRLRFENGYKPQMIGSTI